MEKISEHITFVEATKSQSAVRAGIANIPNDQQLASMKQLAEKVFEPLRNQIGKPIGISSFFRSAALNSKVGGSTSSQHCKGEAMDLDADIFGGLTNKQIFDFILANMTFDQLIWEFGNNINPDWVHVSYKVSGNRHQVMKSVSVGGVTKYLNF